METRPREQGAETHCGMLSIARRDRGQAARGKETALSPGPSHHLCKGSFMPCHWRAASTEHSIPSGAEGMSVRIPGCSWKRGSLPSLADDILIKFSSLRSAPNRFSGQGFIWATPAPACPLRAQQLADHSLLPRKAWNSLGLKRLDFQPREQCPLSTAPDQQMAGQFKDTKTCFHFHMLSKKV